MATRISKAVRSLFADQQIKKAGARGTMSGYVVGVSHEWGQPLQTSSDASGLITPERMREIILKTPTAGASHNATLDYAGGVKLNLRNIDPSKPVAKKQAKTIRKLLTNPNPTQTSRQFRLALISDLFTLGFAAIEIEPDEMGQPVNLWVMDAARLKVDFDEHGTILGYDMLDAYGRPIIRGQNSSASMYQIPENGSDMGFASPYSKEKGVHGWEPEEVIFFNLNPQSKSVYPYSRITQLFTTAVVEDLMMAFIGGRFTDSNVPFGVMDMGDITEQELKIAIANWNAQANEQHRILLTGSRGGSKFIPFGYHLKDLEATSLLAEVRGKIMSIVGVTMNELGESQDVNKSNGYNLSYTFKKRAIEPMLNEITETLTRRLLWDTLGYYDAEFYYDEIDSRDELLQAQIDDIYLKMGVETINSIRNRRGQQSVGGGDDSMMYTGSAWVPTDMVRDMAKQMLISEATAVGGSVNAPEGAESERLRVGGQAPKNSTGMNKPEGARHAMRSVTGSKNG